MIDPVTDELMVRVPICYFGLLFFAACFRTGSSRIATL
jgi:hypothetical protein